MDLVGGAVDPRGGYVSKILHVKRKESGPVGGARPPRSANALVKLIPLIIYHRHALSAKSLVCWDVINNKLVG